LFVDAGLNLSENLPNSFRTSTPNFCDAVLHEFRSPHVYHVSKAFVVQFTGETTTQTATFSGRVEHFTSGRRARFASAEELVAVVRKTLVSCGVGSTISFDGK